MTVHERIQKARLGIILTPSCCFFGALLMRLEMRPAQGETQTFCTDGRVILYHEPFAATLTDPELRGVLLHEVCHCAQLHPFRMGHRDPEKWNHAADYQINLMLEESLADITRNQRVAPPWKLPDGGLLDPQYRDLCAEEIYNRLPPTPPDKGGRSGGAGKPGCGDVMPAPQPGHGEPAAPTEDEWKVAIVQAATVAKMRGELPAGVARLLGEVLAPKVPWREVLREFIRQIARDDYSWRRPNRRYLPQGVVLPGLYSERMGRLAVAIDTSGSISGHVLAEFAAETQAALDEAQPESLDVIYCDARVNGTAEFRPGDTVALEPKGGGGTRFAPVFDHIAQRDEEPPVALIYLTDGHGSFPAEPPAYPVLWASTDRADFPFGQTVAVK